MSFVEAMKNHYLRGWRRLSWTPALLLAVGAAQGQVTLSLGTGAAAPGSATTLSLTLNSTATNGPAGLQWTLGFTASEVSGLVVTSGPSATAAAKTLSCVPAAGIVRCILYGLTSAVIPNGVVASVQVTLANTVPAGGQVAVQVTGVQGTTAGGAPMTTSGTPGTVAVPAPDTQPPTAPGVLTALAVSGGQINLSWGAATDNTGVTSYRIERCAGLGCTGFAQVATAAGTSYPDLGLTPNTRYEYRVRAQDAAGNLGFYSSSAGATTLATISGLVAAYGFEEGTGTTTADRSGNGLTGTLQSAAWTTQGRFGNALSFNGTSSAVSVGDAAPLDLTTGMTLMAWVYPTANGAYRTVVLKEDAPDLAYAIYSSSSPGPPGGYFRGGTVERNASSSSVLALNTWSHLATTYDGANLRFYINGVQAGVTATTGAINVSTGPFKIGGNSIWSEWFAGRIDEVRVYNRALSLAEVVSDMNAAVGSGSTPPPAPDTQAPSAPGTPTVSAASATQINVSWSAATDNVAVTGYRVERCQGAGCATFTQVSTPTGLTFADSGLTAATDYSYRVRAIDAAGNLGPYSQAASARTLNAPDTQAPSAPGAPAATATSSTQITVSWPAATDNFGVTGYRLERCQGAGCANFAQIATPAGLTYTDSGLTAATDYSYRVRAVDAAGNLGPYSPAATARTQNAPDTQAPTAPAQPSVTVISESQINLTWTAATDNVGVTGYRLERCQGAGCTTFAQIATPAGLTYADSGLTAATDYSYRIRAVDAAGNLGPYSPAATAKTLTAISLAAAYGFEEGTGTTTVDSSGNQNLATLQGAVWSTQGRFGRALSFNGTSQFVTVPDAPVLDLSNGMTLMAWVYPTAAAGARNVLLKEDAGDLAYGLYANTDLETPGAYYRTGTVTRQVNGSATLPLNVWSHVAVTYSGSSLVLYLNGNAVSTAPFVGTINATAGPLKIGGNAVWGEWFQGRIDEVRVYRRALTAAEVTTDMNTAIAAPTVDQEPPTAPGSISASAISDRQINVTWATATDNVGVTGYRLERCQGAACTSFTQIATPSLTNYADAGLAAGSPYSYRVRAVDAAGNLGAYSPVAAATTLPGTAMPAVSGLTCSPATLTGAASSSCTVTISPAAGSGGFSVALTSDNPNLRVPASVLIAAGATAGSFTATASAVGTAQIANLGAAGGGVSRTFAVSLTAPGWSISGTLGASGAGAAVNLTGALTGTVVADGTGSYSFGSLGAGTYTVTPVKSGVTFTPANRTVTLSTGSAIGVNFGAETPAGSLITVDARAWRDQRTASSTIVSPVFSTTSGGQLLLALMTIGTTRNGDPRTRRMSGGGLEWSRISRASGADGSVEIWRAFATQTLTNAAVTASLSASAVSSMTVLSFAGVDPTTPIGVVRSKSASRGAASDTLLTTRGGSLIVAVGNDPASATSRTLIAGQNLVHEALIGTHTFWSQAAAGPATAGASVTVGVTAPSSTPYNFSLCELLPAASAPPQSAEEFPVSTGADVAEARPAGRPRDGAARLASAVTGVSGEACSPGSIATLLGAGLSDSIARAAGYPLPLELGGRAVRVNGERAPLLLVAPEQINFQCPDLPAGTPLRIETSGTPHPAVVESVMKALSPELFQTADGHGVIAIASGGLAGREAPSRQARPGEKLVLYATGLGDWASTATRATLRVVVDGWEIEPDATLLAPGGAGLYQIRFQLPEGAPLGADVPVYLKLTFEDGGRTRIMLSNSVRLAVEAEQE